MSGQFGVMELIVLVVMFTGAAVFVGLPACIICRRIGWHPLVGILAVIPLVNIALLWYVAMSRWPSMPAGPRDLTVATH